MTDLELLFLVLVLIYGWECACWLRRGSVAFRTWVGRRWRLIHPGALLGNSEGGFVFAHPLPPLGTLLTANLFPLSLSPEAVLAYVAPTINPGWRPVQTGNLFRFDNIRRIQADGKKVRVNGELFMKTTSPSFAGRLVEQLERLVSLVPASRASAIEQMLRDSFDLPAVERRRQEFEKESRPLRLLTNLLFMYLFVFVPILLWNFGFRRWWLELLAGLLAFTVSTSVLFYRAHKKLYPAAEDERFTLFITVLLSPATTLRARDLLSRPLLENFHPLATAKLLCAEEEFRKFARSVLLDTRHPALPLCPREDPAVAATEQYWRGLLKKALERFLDQNGIRPEVLAQPPLPADETCCSYCPRCLAQFTTREGVCADCGGRALVAFCGPDPGTRPGVSAGALSSAQTMRR